MEILKVRLDEIYFFKFRYADIIIICFVKIASDSNLFSFRICYTLYRVHPKFKKSENVAQFIFIRKKISD